MEKPILRLTHLEPSINSGDWKISGNRMGCIHSRIVKELLIFENSEEKYAKGSCTNSVDYKTGKPVPGSLYENYNIKIKELSLKYHPDLIPYEELLKLAFELFEIQ